MFGPFGSPAGMPPMGGGGVLSQLYSQGGPGLAALLAAIQGGGSSGTRPPLSVSGTQAPMSGGFQAPLPIPPASNAGFQPFAPQPAPPPVFNPIGNPQGQFQQNFPGVGFFLQGGQGGSDGGRGLGGGNEAGGQPGSAGSGVAKGLADLGVGFLGGAVAPGFGTLAGIASALTGTADPMGFGFGPAGPLGQAMAQNMDINPSAYGFSSDPGFLGAVGNPGVLGSTGYTGAASTAATADTEGDVGNTGGDDGATGDHGSTGEGTGAAGGETAKGGPVKGPNPQNPTQDNLRVKQTGQGLQAGEHVMNRAAVRMIGRNNLQAINRAALARGTPQRKRLVSGKLTVR